MRNRNGRWLALALVALFAAACGGNRALRQAPGQVTVDPNAIPIVVNNQSPYLMDVYADDGDGQDLLIGTVRAGAISTLTLQFDPLAPGPLQLTAAPVNGRGVARSGPLLVNRGNSVRFNIRQNLSASVATVH